jgi:UDP-N-acetylglucosamine 3-dehydrogenase
MLRVGIIGAGGIAGQHAYCYQHIPEAKVVAVADVVLERAQKIAGLFGADALDHGDKIIERDDIDVVDICVPTYLHSEFTIKAARAGKHVLCEKPIALNIEQGLQMIEETRKANVKFMVAHVLRYFPENVRAKQIMESGTIGDPIMVRTYRGGVHPGRVREWYSDISRSGGAIQDTVIHDVDFFKWCFGPVKEVYVKGNTFKKVPYLEYDLLMLEFANGVIAHMTVDWSKPANGHFTTRMEIVGTKGMVEFNADDSSPLHILTSADGAKKDGVAIPESPLDPRSDPYSREIIEFLRCIENDTEPPIPAKEALDTLNTVLACLESEKTGEPVKVREVF